MGSLVPLATQVAQVAQAAGTIASVGSRVIDNNRADQRRDVALQQLIQRQKIERRDAQEKAALDKSEIVAKAAQAETERKNALRRAVARQRAQFGASGISSNGGSAEAVLLGLIEESNDDRHSREKLDALRLQEIDQSLQNKKRVNTLERTQLQQRNNVAGDSSLDQALDIIRLF